MKTNPFILQMKTFIFVLFFSLISFGQVTNVDCSNGQCVLSCGTLNPTCTGSVFSVNPTTKNCSGYDCVVGDIFSTISSSGRNLEAVNITSDLVLKPQNLKMTIENGPAPGQDLTVNLNAKSPTWDYASSFTLFTDNVNQMSVNLNGYSGKNGKDASEICADKIKNGDYGAGVQSFFNTRRASDPQINQDRCDLQDLNYMQQFSFSCDDPSYNEINVANPTVSVQRVKSRARCNAVGSYSDCVKKKVRVTCNYALWSTAKNRWLSQDDLFLSSWVSNQYESSFTQTTVCGTGNLLNNGNQSCQPGQYVNGSSHVGVFCSGGSIPVIDSIFNGLSSSDQSACNNVLISSNFDVTYYKYDLIQSRKRTFVPLIRTGTQVGPFSESFFQSESNRLGGVAGFCQLHGLNSAIAANPNGFFANITGYPSSSTPVQRCSFNLPNQCINYGSIVGTVCHRRSVIADCGSTVEGATSSSPINQYSYYDAAGIPYEQVSDAINPNWQTETSAQHPIVYSSSYARASIWKATSGSTMTFTPEVYNDPLNPNNDHWEKLTTNVFQACPADYTLAKNNYITLTQYADSPALCSSVTDPQDPANLAQWQYTGMSQETIHGVESVSCSIGSCAVNSSVSDLDRNVDVIIPGDGEDGTEQGRGLIFAYNIKNLSRTAVAGVSGSKGASDVSISSQVRICAKIDDATAGINTAQAKNPFVSFRRYNWQSVKSNNAGNNGVPPRQNGKKVEVFKKIDPGLRYFLEKSLN